VELLPDAHHHACRANLGFAAACNIGVRGALQAGAAATLLINPDIVTLPGFLNRLVGACTPLDEACAAPEVFWLWQPKRTWFAGAWRGRVPGTFVRRRPGDPRCAVDYLWATCLLVGRTVWQRATPFDPIYFLFYEDMDWCARARAAGVTPRVVADASAWHGAGGSTDPPLSAGLHSFRQFHMTRSGVVFDRRHGLVPPSVGGVVRAAAAVRTALGLAARGDGSGLAAHCRGYAAGWRLELPPPPWMGLEP
jgi:hypothetical protein